MWEVTLPFEEPLKLVKQNNNWISVGKSHADTPLIEAIGHAIDEQHAA